MKKLVSAFRRNNKGFTLIELLIVVGILGILAGVVTLGVTQFIGRGKTEAQSTELHNVQTAVAALMSDRQLAAFSAAGVVGPADNLVVDLDATTSIGPYIVTALRGTYNVAANGNVAYVSGW